MARGVSARCPLCGAPGVPAFRPFCGRGCKDRDLLRWLDAGYRIPGRGDDPDRPDAGVDKADDAD